MNDATAVAVQDEEARRASQTPAPRTQRSLTITGDFRPRFEPRVLRLLLPASVALSLADVARSMHSPVRPEEEPHVPESERAGRAPPPLEPVEYTVRCQPFVASSLCPAAEGPTLAMIQEAVHQAWTAYTAVPTQRPPPSTVQTALGMTSTCFFWRQQCPLSLTFALPYATQLPARLPTNEREAHEAAGRAHLALTTEAELETGGLMASILVPGPEPVQWESMREFRGRPAVQEYAARARANREILARRQAGLQPPPPPAFSPAPSRGSGASSSRGSGDRPPSRGPWPKRTRR